VTLRSLRLPRQQDSAFIGHLNQPRDRPLSR
jgi:hypothetical protein